jgi:hypothetical protein
VNVLAKQKTICLKKGLTGPKKEDATKRRLTEGFVKRVLLGLVVAHYTQYAHN